jgi:hypothetical protein
MANTFDIKSKNVVIGTAAANTNFDIGAVPAGKQRFVTFVKAANLHRGAGSTNTLYLASHSTSQLTTSAAAIAAKKMTIPFIVGDTDQVVQVPEGGPDLQTPLFAIAASGYLAARTLTGNVDVFVQYFED